MLCCLAAFLLEEALEAQVFVQMFPVDAKGRERILFALARGGITEAGVVGKTLTGLAAIGRLHPNLGRRELNFLNLHHWGFYAAKIQLFLEKQGNSLGNNTY